MKKLITFILFLAVVFSVKSANPSAQLIASDTFDISNAIIPLRIKSMPSLRDTSVSVLKETKEEVLVHIDSQRVIIYDTVKIIESSKEEPGVINTDELIPTSNPSKKETVRPIGDIISFGNIFWSIVILIAAYYVIKALVTIIESFAERSTNYRITLKSLSPFVRIAGWIIAIIWVVEGVFELSNDKLFAFAASAGLAIGFASQDVLKNIFGGIMILFDKPFQVGDKIEVGAIYGEVKEIGLRSTRIVTKDDSLVSVPNAEVVNNAVSNSNAGEANCQVVAEIYLPIDTDTNAARLIATEAAQVSRYIYLNKPIVVLFFNELIMGKSYLKMRVKAYVSDIRNEFSFKSDMTEIIMKEFLKQGIFKKEDVQ